MSSKINRSIALNIANIRKSEDLTQETFAYEINKMLKKCAKVLIFCTLFCIISKLRMPNCRNLSRIP